MKYVIRFHIEVLYDQAGISMGTFLKTYLNSDDVVGNEVRIIF